MKPSPHLRRRLLLVFLSVACLTHLAHAGPCYTYQEVLFPGATSTEARGINDCGQIVGLFNGNNAYEFGTGSYSCINVPGGSYAFAQGINNSGQVAGLCGDSTFVLTSGNFSVWSLQGSNYTAGMGISSTGSVSGYYSQGGSLNGFVEQNGVFTTVDAPGASGTFLCGINACGQVVGNFVDVSGQYHGFIEQCGVFNCLNAPGAISTSAFGINDLGQVVGDYVDANGVSHGFVESGGAYTTLDFIPGYNASYYGINNLGQVVGTCNVVGDTSGTSYGFVATPDGTPQLQTLTSFEQPSTSSPEPATGMGVTIGLIAAALSATRRKLTRRSN